MSVKQGLLALLAERPMYGYLLRQEFEDRTAGSWPVNIGQVYTTLARLQRDGLVEPVESGADGEGGSVTYRLTEAGRAQVERWWRTPVPREAPARDELAIKIALSVASPGVDVAAVVQNQRSAIMATLQEHTRRAARLPERPTRDELPRTLVLDRQIFEAEAELRWLEHVELRLAGAAPQPTPNPDQEAAR